MKKKKLGCMAFLLGGQEKKKKKGKKAKDEGGHKRMQDLTAINSSKMVPSNLLNAYSGATRGFASAPEYPAE